MAPWKGAEFGFCDGRDLIDALWRKASLGSELIGVGNDLHDDFLFVIMPRQDGQIIRPTAFGTAKNGTTPSPVLTDRRMVLVPFADFKGRQRMLPIQRAYIDKGCCGRDAQNPRPVFIFGRGVFGIINRELRGRSAIEPIIGHLKACPLDRCYLKSRAGVAANVIPSTLAFATANRPNSNQAVDARLSKITVVVFVSAPA